MRTNLILHTDSYKVTHYKQYPAGTQTVYSFLESRGGKYPAVTFFGLQYILKTYLAGEVVRAEDIAEAAEYFAAHFGKRDLFNREGWQRIVEVHGGRLPILIKAVPEGTTVPVSNALMTVENLDPQLPWLTNYLETLLCQVWYPSTVCTQSRAMKSTLRQYLEQTGDPGLIDFKLHDFGFRGSTSVESSALGGAAHLVNFKGTDTMSALRLVRQYYDEPMAGYSIPAAEHSTITSWGRNNESAAYANMLAQYPTGLVAVVSDSYDVFRACRDIWGSELRDQVLNRDGTLVVRPDSGDPPTVVVKVLEILGLAFGCSVNDKGYRVLNPKVRVIQGDGIDHAMLASVLNTLAEHRWSTDNIAFGSGGGLLQKLDRDTLRFAFKCSAIQVNDAWHGVMKNPATDHCKKSKAGRFKLIHANGQFQTVGINSQPELTDWLVPVFSNGQLLIDQTFSQIRERASLGSFTNN